MLPVAASKGWKRLFVGKGVRGEDFIVISIYVGNLPYDTTSEQLVELFSQYGSVHRASLVTDRETHRPRGFGFVEMPERNQAEQAIEALSGQEFNGRPLTVNEARKNNNRNSGNTSRAAHPDDDPADDEAPNDDEQGPSGYSNTFGKG